jgi:hypothetical protein
VENGVAYRSKPDLNGAPQTPEERRQQRYILWLLPPIVLGPNSVSIARALGFHASREVALYGVMVMGVVCIVGAIVSYRNARAAVARHVEELTHPGIR